MEAKQVAGLARAVGITHQAAISKGTELLRLLKLKLPGNLGAGEICRPAVCLEIACSIVPGSKMLLRQQFQRYSCAPAKVYDEVYSRAQGVLDVRRDVDVVELVTLFGCSDVQEPVQRLLRAYKARCVEGLSGGGGAAAGGTAQQGSRADFSRPVFLAAAFYLAARRHRAKVERDALLTRMGVAKGDFTVTQEHMAQMCADLLAGPGAGGAGAGTSSCSQPRTPQSQQRGSAQRKRSAAAASLWPGAVAAEAEEEGGAEDVALEAFKLVLIGRQASVPAQRHPAAWAEPDHGHAPHVHGSDASGSEQGQRPRPRGKEARRQYGMEGVEEGQEQVDEGGEVQGTPGVREVRPVVRCRPSAGKQQARKQQQQHMGQEQEAEEGRVVGFGGKAAVPAVAVAAPDEEQRPKRQRR